MSVGWKLEVTTDDLSVSNAAATWEEISDLLKENTLKWSGGIDRLGDESKPGEMSFTLLGRQFEPLNSASPWYPYVRRYMRFKLSLLHGLTFESEFIGFARTFQPTWPGNVSHSEVEIVCGDGHDILGKDPLPSLDPIDATTHGEVLAFDQPSFQYGLHEPAGTKVVAQVRKKRVRGKIIRTRTRRIETTAEVEGVSGPAGVYFNTPTLGEPGLVPGDPATSVLFTRASSEYARVALEEPITLTGLSIETVVKLATDPAGAEEYTMIGGPGDGGGSNWKLAVDSSGSPFFYAVFPGPVTTIAQGGSLAVADGSVHVRGDWDGQYMRIYVDGFLEDEVLAQVANITVPTADFLYLGRNESGLHYLNGWMQDVAIYEKHLTGARGLAHALSATARGYAEQLAGDRIEAIATSSLWSEARIQSGVFNVQPVMQHGQAKLEEIGATMNAEGFRPLLFFDGNGDPVYLGWEWMGGGTYSTPQAIFGSPRDESEDELFFASSDVVFDDEVYSTVTLARDGGESQTLTNEDSDAVFGSAAEPIGGLLNSSDEDVASLAEEMIMLYAEPLFILPSLDLNGADEDELEQLLEREIGHMLRFRRRSDETDDISPGPPIDIITHIIGYEKRLEAGDNLTGTWKLARGFDANEEIWRMGITGFSEIGETTTLG